MIDDQTSTVWTHLGGKALQGTLDGRKMEIIPLQHMIWAKWLELHPDTLVLSPDTPYTFAYQTVQIGSPGVPSSFNDSFVNVDERLPENTLVAGVNVGDAFRAYPLDTIAEVGGVVNDVLDGEPIVVVFDFDSTFMLAYSREVGDRTIEFETDASDGFHLIDKETGDRWSIDGQALEGDLDGQSLHFVVSYITEWYGWSAYHPSTDIYE